MCITNNVVVLGRKHATVFIVDWGRVTIHVVFQLSIKDSLGTLHFVAYLATRLVLEQKPFSHSKIVRCVFVRCRRPNNFLTVTAVYMVSKAI